MMTPSPRPAAAAALLLALALPAPAQEPERAPIPGTAERTAAMKRLESAFAERLASRDPEVQAELAVQLFAMTTEDRVDGAARYAMLDRSAALAATAGRVALLEDVIGELEERFEAVPLAYHDRLLRAADKGLDETADAGPLVVAWLRLADRARRTDDWSEALRAVERARALARRLGDRGWIAHCQEKMRAVRALRQLLSRPDAPPARFADDPASAAVRGAYGEYLCLARRRWREGIPFVLEGPADGALVPLARREKALADCEPGDRSPALQAALAEACSEAAGRARRRLDAASLHDRARHHWSAARNGLGALERAAVEARLREIPEWVEAWCETPPFTPVPWSLHAVADRARLDRHGPYLSLRLEKENNMWGGVRGTAPFWVRALAGHRDEVVVSYRLPETGLPDKAQFAVCVWDGDGFAAYCGPQKDTDNAPDPSIRCLASTPESATFAGRPRIDHGRSGQLRLVWESGVARFSWRAAARDGWTEIQAVETRADMKYLGVMAKKWGPETLEVSFRIH